MTMTTRISGRYEAASAARRNPPARPSAHRVRPLHWTAWALVWGLLLGAASVHGAEEQPLRPGQEIVLGRCLHLSVMSIRDRDGVMDQNDWITVRLRNECQESRRHLMVELILQDAVGYRYGARLWLLSGGEVLRPGAAKTEHYAVPDPDNRTPSLWSARLVYVEAKRPHRRVPPGGTPRRARAGRRQ